MMEKVTDMVCVQSYRSSCPFVCEFVVLMFCLPRLEKGVRFCTSAQRGWIGISSVVTSDRCGKALVLCFCLQTTF